MESWGVEMTQRWVVSLGLPASLESALRGLEGVDVLGLTCEQLQGYGLTEVQARSFIRRHGLPQPGAPSPTRDSNSASHTVNVTNAITVQCSDHATVHNTVTNAPIHNNSQSVDALRGTVEVYQAAHNAMYACDEDNQPIGEGCNMKLQCSVCSDYKKTIRWDKKQSKFNTNDILCFFKDHAFTAKHGRHVHSVQV